MTDALVLVAVRCQVVVQPVNDISDALQAKTQVKRVGLAVTSPALEPLVSRVRDFAPSGEVAKSRP